MPLWQRGIFVRREHCEVLTRVLLQYRLLLRFSCSWSKLEAEICRIAVRNIVSAGRMLDARKRGLGGRGGRRQAVSAAFIAFSNRAPPQSGTGLTTGYLHAGPVLWVPLRRRRSAPRSVGWLGLCSAPQHIVSDVVLRCVIHIPAGLYAAALFFPPELLSY